MGRLFLVDLEGRFYSCKSCRTHLALCSDVISRSFHSGRSGKAYLFNKVVNVFSGEKEERNMMTGKYTAADIFCVKCATMLGWEYESAHEESQKYKEGKSVLVRVKISGHRGPNAAAGNVADNNA